MAGEGFAPVLAALATMQSSLDTTKKAQAHTFLEIFQKSVCICCSNEWVPTLNIVEAGSMDDKPCDDSISRFDSGS